MDIRTKGLNHLCFPTYYRGPFVASNIANMYCTECIIGIIQNRTQELPLGSASPVLGVMREGLNHLCFPTYYRGPFVASKYCESTPRSQVNLSHDSSRSRRAVGWACELPLGSATEAIRSVQIKRGIEPPVLSYILQRPIRSVQYCEYVLYRMYYRYHTERRNSLSAPLRPYMRTPSRLRYRGPFVPHPTDI